jgi:anti-sigma regulatory factor (Ser/Thr protein kinase)
MEVSTGRVPVPDRSAVGEVRRLAKALALRAGFDEEAVGRVAIVATELATNIVKHGEDGHCIVGLAEQGGESVVQIVAVDSGRGLEDPSNALHNGYSTTATPGTGLGAVRRLSRGFDLYSEPGNGAVVVARIGGTPPQRVAPEALGHAVQVGSVEVAMPGEPVSGDAWALESDGSLTTILVADGLGHGVLAAESSRLAVASFLSRPDQGPAARIGSMHEAVRGTRGAAVAVAEIDPAGGNVRYAGIGNITGRIVDDDGAHSLVSLNGTAGHAMRTVREFSYAFAPGALLVLHSDGLSARWTLDRYPGIMRRDPALIAALLLRDFGRERDDAVVVVARNSLRVTGAREAR